MNTPPIKRAKARQAAAAKVLRDTAKALSAPFVPGVKAPKHKPSPGRIRTEVVKDLPALLKKWRGSAAAPRKAKPRTPAAGPKKPKAKVLPVLTMDKLHTCPKCRRKDFTRAGLARHRCGPVPLSFDDKTPVLTLTAVAPPRLCAHCGADISHRRKQANTCGLTCRVALARSK